eukprot:1159564-Pelagomonas_calceolata.AAC.2
MTAGSRSRLSMLAHFAHSHETLSLAYTEWCTSSGVFRLLLDVYPHPLKHAEVALNMIHNAWASSGYGLCLRTSTPPWSKSSFIHPEELAFAVYARHSRCPARHSWCPARHSWCPAKTHGVLLDTHNVLLDTHGVLLDTHAVLLGTNGVLLGTNGVLLDTHGGHH